MKGYPAGWPLWTVVARTGVPIRIDLKVIHDHEANVFAVVESNVPGLNAEAETLDELLVNVRAAAADLFVELVQRPNGYRAINLSVLEDCVPA